MANIDKIGSEEIEKVKSVLTKHQNVFWKGTTQFDDLMKNMILAAYKDETEKFYGDCTFCVMSVVKSKISRVFFMFDNGFIIRSMLDTTFDTAKTTKSFLKFAIPVWGISSLLYNTFRNDVERHVEDKLIDNMIIDFSDVVSFMRIKYDTGIEFEIKNEAKSVTFDTMKIFLDNETNEVKKIILALILKILSRIEQEEERTEVLIGEFQNLTNDSDNERKLEICNEMLNLLPENQYWNIMKALTLANLDRVVEAVRYIKIGSDLFKKENGAKDNLSKWNKDTIDLFHLSKLVEATIHDKTGKFEDAIWSLQDGKVEGLSLHEIEDLNEQRDEVYLKFIANFGSKDYKYRKVIFIEDELPSFRPKNIVALKRSELGNLKFPPSHPVPGQLYVGHPMKENLYYPIEDYENHLFQSQVMELSSLLKSLGAVKIKTEYIKGTTNSREQNEVQSHQEHKNRGNDTGIGTRAGGVQQSTNIDRNTSAHSESGSQNESEVGKRMSIDGTFKPTKKPFIPADLIWFEHNEIWKSLANQRLEGGLESYDLILSTKNVEQVNERELKTLDEEYKMLLSVSGGNLITKGHNDIKNETDSSKSYESLLKLKKKETNDMRVYVEFAPMETLTEEVPKLNTTEPLQQLELENQSTKYTEAETEYIEFLHDMIEDGKIEDASRRVLERRRVKLGLSEERAAAIENEILNKSNFTEIELDFIQEIEFCFEDDGIIDESEMRMLNRKRDKLGITEERSAELIEFVKNKR